MFDNQYIKNQNQNMQNTYSMIKKFGSNIPTLFYLLAIDYIPYMHKVITMDVSNLHSKCCCLYCIGCIVIHPGIAFI